MTRARILSKRFGVDQIVTLTWIEHRAMGHNDSHSIEAEVVISLSSDSSLWLRFVDGGMFSLDGGITLVEARWQTPHDDESLDDEIVTGGIKFWLVDDEAVTAQEVANEFGLAASTVTRAAERGEITARKAGRIWLIRRADAEARWGGDRKSADQ